MQFSPQSQAIYTILLESGRPLSVKQLAGKLHIFPAATYRLMEPLLTVGLITKTNTYPYLFTAKSPNEGLSLFLLHQTAWFSKEFPSTKTQMSKKGTQHTSQDLSFSFIQSRDELMSESAKEIAKATKSVDLLRSGHELSADVMLAITHANKRNITTRMLIQDYSKGNAQQVLYWQKNGILVRKTKLVHTRLMIYDAETLYFMSYKHADSQKDLGIKISYAPFAVMLSQLFEQWWNNAEEI